MEEAAVELEEPPQAVRAAAAPQTAAADRNDDEKFYAYYYSLNSTFAATGHRMKVSIQAVYRIALPLYTREVYHYFPL